MKQLWIPHAGDPDVFELRDAPTPEPGPGQVRIQVHAAGVNFADVMARMGVYDDAPPFPFVVGYEVAGEIDAVGPGVDPGRVGEQVLAMTRFGGYSTAVVVDALQAVPRPPGVDAVTGASIPVTGLTAWMMCEVMGRVRAGDKVLVHSAGGGVGLMVLDLLRWRGATAYGTASGHKHAELLERGYHRLVDYRKEDFEQALADVGGFDLIIDPVGGESWAKGLRLLAPGGRLACFGLSATATGERATWLDRLRAILAIPWFQLLVPSLINHNQGVLGVNMGRLWDEGERVTGWLTELLALVADGTVRPQVHAAVPFADVAEAHRILHRRENVGKVVLVTEASVAAGATTG
ncbi:MAG: zinc-binding dehydrogenase [Alphaproteobacteria bacterium]|nr:zinc-binding dehydrogenase [Alphaproteobacteria bacterium]